MCLQWLSGYVFDEAFYEIYVSQEDFLVGTNLLKIDKLTLAFNSVCKSKKDVVKSISLT